MTVSSESVDRTYGVRIFLREDKERKSTGKSRSIDVSSIMSAPCVSRTQTAFQYWWLLADSASGMTIGWIPNASISARAVAQARVMAISVRAYSSPNSRWEAKSTMVTFECAANRSRNPRFFVPSTTVNRTSGKSPTNERTDSYIRADHWLPPITSVSRGLCGSASGMSVRDANNSDPSNCPTTTVLADGK